MCNEQGQNPRTGIKKNASPISTKLNEAFENVTINIEQEESLDEFIKDIQYIQECYDVVENKIMKTTSETER